MNKALHIITALAVFCLCAGRLAAQNDPAADDLRLVQAAVFQTQAFELYKQGKHSEAIPLAKKALEIYEQVLGENRTATATSLALLATFYRESGNYAAAEPLFKRSLAIMEKTLFAEDLKLGHVLGGLGRLYYEMGKYAEAEPLYKRSLVISEKNLGTEDVGIGARLNDLAQLYRAMSNYESAEPLYKRSLAISEKTCGPEHPNTATSLNNLAGFYCNTGNYVAAEPLYKRSLAIQEKVLGPEHPSTATCLNGLAMFYMAMGNYAAAEPLYKRSLAIQEKVLGPNHPDTATSLSNLANLYDNMANYAAAEPLYKRSLAIREKVLGPDHPATATSLSNLSGVLAARGQPREALAATQTAWRIEQKERDQVFGFASEHEQAAFANAHSAEFNCNLSLATEHLAENPAARSFASSVVLSSKGAALEALSKRQSDVLASSAPELKKLFAEWQSVGAQLVKAVMATPKLGQQQTRVAWIADLEKRKEAAEQVLARASARFAGKRQASRVTSGDVARALVVGSVLVEFAKYQSYRFGAKGKEAAWGDWKYIALVLRGGTNSAEPDVALVSLGTADKIEAAVKKWRKAAAPDEQGRRSEKSALDAASQELAALVWNPIVPALAGCRKVYVSPDGELSFVSFASLPGSKPDSFVIDDYDITYVGTGRDLVRTGSSEASAPLLVGAPDFGTVSPSASSASSAVQKQQKGLTADGADSADAEQKELLAMRTGISDLRSFSALSFPPLPGTRTEVESVGRLLQDRKQNPSLLTGSKADEATVKTAKHPAILHLATHGFFLPDTGLNEMTSSPDLFRSQLGGDMGNAAAGKLWRQMKLRNPMHRSGIALAGANDTIRGRREAGGNDGILTAEEVAGMDLWGTRMVVISACESGLGEAKGGEGVFGLRRAFTIAGAQSLVMTLWAVSDDATRQLMESLYRHLPEQRTPQRALLAAQREWIAKKRAAGLYPHPVHWASFVASGIGTALEEK